MKKNESRTIMRIIQIFEAVYFFLYMHTYVFLLLNFLLITNLRETYTFIHFNCIPILRIQTYEIPSFHDTLSLYLLFLLKSWILKSISQNFFNLLSINKLFPTVHMIYFISFLLYLQIIHNNALFSMIFLTFKYLCKKRYPYTLKFDRKLNIVRQRGSFIRNT